MANINNCEYCNKEYEVCSNCKDDGIYRWRMHFCSVQCFQDGFGGSVKIMRIQYGGIMWNVKEYNLKKGEYTLTRDKKEITVAETDELIQAFIITPSQYIDMKYGKFTKAKKTENVD